MIPFPLYASAKDRYCVAYFGHCVEYIYQLWLVKPALERAFPGLRLYIGCRDEYALIMGICGEILRQSELRERKLDFGHLREIAYNGKTHPVEDFIRETGLQIESPPMPEPQNLSRRCVIYTQGHHPTRSLTAKEIEKLKSLAVSRGFEPELDTPVGDAGWVVGVECLGLFEAAHRRIPTRLVPTGVGEGLFRTLFPWAEVA